MAERWERKTVTDNAGNPLLVWCWREYELCRNVNLGHEGGWVFELTRRGSRVDLHPTLEEGQDAARRHAAGLCEGATSGDVTELESAALEALA